MPELQSCRGEKTCFLPGLAIYFSILRFLKIRNICQNNISLFLSNGEENGIFLSILEHGQIAPKEKGFNRR